MPTAPTIEIPLTRPPFSIEEYRRRQDAVMGQVAGEKLDALLVTANTHQEYLAATTAAAATSGRSRSSSSWAVR